MDENSTNAKYPWSESFVRAAIMLSTLAIASIGVTWIIGTKFHLYSLICMAAYMLTIFAIGSRRRWKNSLQSDQSKSPWYRFSIIELLILCTGIAFVFNFAKMEMIEHSSSNTWQQKVSIEAVEYLGIDGRFHFDSNGDINIAICDRGFDDARLREVADFIAQQNLQEHIHSVTFGTGVKTMGTPASWIGITDRSVNCLLQWHKLKVLMLHGTAITLEGKEQLSQIDSLELLNL